MGLDALLEKDLLCVEAGDHGDIIEEAFVATRILMAASGHEVPESTNRFVDLLRSLANEVQAACCESQAESRELEGQKAKVRALELKVQLLTSAAEKTFDL